MEPVELEQRLSRIATRWTVVRDAHAGGGAARGRLLLDYRGAVYRYLLGATRDPDVAEELSQDFAVRFLRGDFHRANPERGRFRDYVKTALINLVNDHHRDRKAKPVALATDTPQPLDPPSADTFLQDWRQDVLDQTWAALAAANPTYHAVLMLRIENPDAQSPELAERAAAQLGKAMTPENSRKTLQRAHAKFAQLLLDQVAASLDDADNETLETELRALDVLKYCRTALAARCHAPRTE